MCCSDDRSFHSFEELTDLLLRGGEIELLFKQTAYTLLPIFTGMEVTSIDVGIRRDYRETPDPNASIQINDWTQYPIDRIEEIGDIVIEGRKLREILRKSEVLFRPD